MLLIFIIIFILAHIAPPLALAVSLMAWFSLHWFITILLIVFLA